MQCVMSLHQTLQGNERKAKSPARHREAYRSRLVRLGCEVMEDRVLLSAALPDYHFTVPAIVTGKAAPKPAFTATTISTTQINVSWAKVSGATKYLVRELVKGNWKQIAILNNKTTGCAITGLSPNTTYSFDVGFVKGGRETWMATKSAKTLPISAPAAPGWWDAVVSANQINLAWTGVAGATGYLVDEWINGVWKQIGNLGSGSTGCAVTGLSPNTTYYFDVAAYNAAGTTWANYRSATTFQNTVGVDHPAADTAYSPVSGSLFGANGPSYLDVQQGAVGDCWLLAVLAEVAARDPSDIQDMFTYDGTTLDNGSVVGLYTVRFFNNAGAPEYVTVDTELPSGGGYYDQPVNGVLWVALAEKAYAQANGAGFVTTSSVGSDSYNALNGGDPSWAFRAITGKSASDYSINPGNIASAWTAGNLIVLITSNPSSPYIVGDHCYAVVGYSSSSSMPFEVFNPWGTDSSGWVPGYCNQIYGLFWAGAGFLSQNFTGQSFGTGTAAGLDDHGNCSQEGAGSANSGSAISASTRLSAGVVGNPLRRGSKGKLLNGIDLSAQHPMTVIELAPTSSSQSIGRRHDHLDRALGWLMEDDLAFLRS